MKRILFSIVAVLISAAALFGQKWDICLNLEKGREYRIRMHTTSFMQQKLMGLAVSIIPCKSICATDSSIVFALSRRPLIAASFVNKNK